MRFDLLLASSSPIKSRLSIQSEFSVVVTLHVHYIAIYLTYLMMIGGRTWVRCHAISGLKQGRMDFSASQHQRCAND